MHQWIEFFIFARMKYVTREEDLHQTCLQCGRELYGRPDKKFCGEQCKNRYHTFRHSETLKMRRRVVAALDSNYKILDSLLSRGESSADLPTLEAAGFKPAFVSGHRKLRGHDEYSCYEIRYFQTPTRIFDIRKITVL